MSNNIKEKSGCSGCSACFIVCPVGAIEYKLNDNGFYEAFVDNEKCVNCGKCKKVCTKFDDELEKANNIENGVIYSAQSNDENVIKTCTSGGIAYEIAKYGIENGYSIVGVVYNYSENKAQTIIAKTIKDLDAIKGSKYIQSDVHKAFKDVIKEAKEDENKKYIIFGTPCQIAGIKKVIEIEKINNDIITVDLFCHGVPSYKVWNEYLNWLNNKKKIDKIDNIIFRSKHIGWHDFCIEIHGNDRDYYKCAEGDLFYKAFFDDVLLNESCFNCKTRMCKSYADIRLGDFWGKRYINRQDGVSAVLVLTDTGKKLIENLKENKIINIIDKCNNEECFSTQSIKEYKTLELSKKSFEFLKSNSLEETIKFYRKKLDTKTKIKKSLKESTAILPDKARSILRRISKK